MWYWSIEHDCFYLFCGLFLIIAITHAGNLAAREDVKTGLFLALENDIAHSDPAWFVDGKPAYDERLLEIRLNGHNLRQIGLALVQADGKVWVRAQDLANWHLRAPGSSTQIRQYGNQSFVLLDSLGSLTYQVDTATQSLQIEAPSKDLLPSVIDVYTPARVMPHLPPLGGFVNYDLSAQYQNGTKAMGALAEMGVFAVGGVFTTQLLNRDLTAGESFIRLESTLTVDRPEQLASFRLGDAISRGGMWGRPIRFAGIQWGTNFATQPDYITFPMPTFSGSAGLPSTAEVFINNVRTFQRDVPAGPFSIRELPVITGQGEIRMVVRDLLGREQIISQTYYGARNLLKRGLSDFSYELGVERQNFSTSSNDYGRWLLAGTQRYGLTNELTAEVRGELGSNRQVIGLGGTMLFPSLGVVDIGIAASHSNKGIGQLLVLGFDRLTQQMSFGVRTQLTSHEFDQLGFSDGRRVPAQQTTAHIGWRGSQLGSFGLGYIHLDNRGQPDSELVNASYNKNLGRGWFLGMTAIQNLKGSRDYTIGLTLTYALSNRVTANVTTNLRNNSADSALFQVQQNLPPGTGLGYRLLAGIEGNERFEGGLSMQNNYGTYTLEAAHLNSSNAFRASARGGIAFLGGEAFMARQLGNSFAVVQVPGYSGVQVYAENQPVARTNTSGTALVPQLRPYQKNRLSIEQSDLPMDAQVGALELIAVPYFRSGYVLEFPVQKANGALLRIMMTDAEPVPVGTSVQIIGDENVFPAGLNGQVFLSGLGRHNRLKVTLPDSRNCELEVRYPDTDDPLPDLGIFYCQEFVP